VKDNNLFELEEKLKNKEAQKKKMKVSGKSVFELQKIIKGKGKQEPQEKSNS